MFKKLIATIIACLVFMSGASNSIKATYDETNLTFQMIEIVSDTVVKDESDVYYVFNTMEDRNQFLLQLNGAPSLLSSACLPGDPGYPNCDDNPVVRVESEVINTYTTQRYESGPLLSTWTEGPAEMSINYEETVSFEVEGVGVSVSVGYSSSFPVPAGKEGNIKYKTKFKVTVYQQWAVLKDGTRVKTMQYKTVAPVNGDGTFFAVYR